MTSPLPADFIRSEPANKFAHKSDGTSRSGYWRMAGSPALTRSITDKRLVVVEDTLVSSTTTSPCTYAVEPPCTGRYARWCERSALYLREPPTRFTKLVEVYHVQPRQSYPYQSFADDLPLREKIWNHNFLAHFLP